MGPVEAPSPVRLDALPEGVDLHGGEPKAPDVEEDISDVRVLERNATDDQLG